MSQALQNSSPDFAQARIAMVNSQLHTSGVASEAVLEAYRNVPRELFVPAHCQGVCYLDDEVSVGNGRFLLEPLVHGLMVENAAIRPDDKILDIGGYTGYSTAILSRLALYVVAVDDDAEALTQARLIWLRLGISPTSVIHVCGPHDRGSPGYGPYNVIILNGAVESVPQALLDQLAQGGRLLCVEKAPGSSAGQIRLYTRQGEQISGVSIAAASAPYLPGCEPATRFTF